MGVRYKISAHAFMLKKTMALKKQSIINTIALSRLKNYHRSAKSLDMKGSSYAY